MFVLRSHQDYTPPTTTYQDSNSKPKLDLGSCWMISEEYAENKVRDSGWKYLSHHTRAYAFGPGMGLQDPTSVIVTMSWLVFDTVCYATLGSETKTQTPIMNKDVSWPGLVPKTCWAQIPEMYLMVSNVITGTTTWTWVTRFEKFKTS